MKTLYMKASKEAVSPYVIFSGDPWRVEVLKSYLDNPKHVAFSREFNTWTGHYHGLLVTVTSTGIGSPSAAIAMEEMFECGMKVALRMGTVMSLHDDRLGHFFVPKQSLRLDGTSQTYVEPGFEAIADPDLVETIHQVVTKAGFECHYGLNATLDGFYNQMRESALSKLRGIDIYKRIDELRQQGVDGIDMESATIFVLGRLMGVKTAVLTLATVLENLKTTMEPQFRTEAENMLCKLALDSMSTYARRKSNE